jgi:long-subunit acyl-CoA synthetase (AMP-forming)
VARRQAGSRDDASDPGVRDHLAHEIERVNQRFAGVEQIKRFAILDRDLTQETES